MSLLRDAMHYSLISYYKQYSFWLPLHVFLQCLEDGKVHSADIYIASLKMVKKQIKIVTAPTTIMRAV